MLLLQNNELFSRSPAGLAKVSIPFHPSIPTAPSSSGRLWGNDKRQLHPLTADPREGLTHCSPRLASGTVSYLGSGLREVMLATMMLPGLGVATALKVPRQNFSKSCFSPCWTLAMARAQRLFPRGALRGAEFYIPGGRSPDRRLGKPERAEGCCRQSQKAGTGGSGGGGLGSASFRGAWARVAASLNPAVRARRPRRFCPPLQCDVRLGAGQFQKLLRARLSSAFSLLCLLRRRTQKAASPARISITKDCQSSGRSGVCLSMEGRLGGEGEGE